VAIELPERPGRVIARLARQVELAVATVDLTLSQYRALSLLADGKEAASVLADKLAVSRPSVTGVIDGLVARGLVDRQHEDGDRRRVGLDLTPEGIRVLAAADDEIERRLREVAAHGPQPGFESLAPWRQALDAYRASKHSAKVGAA
jgi:long-chain acyl-CoA synthetase